MVLVSTAVSCCPRAAGKSPTASTSCGVLQGAHASVRCRAQQAEAGPAPVWRGSYAAASQAELVQAVPVHGWSTMLGPGSKVTSACPFWGLRTWNLNCFRASSGESSSVTST